MDDKKTIPPALTLPTQPPKERKIRVAEDEDETSRPVRPFGETTTTPVTAAFSLSKALQHAYQSQASTVRLPVSGDAIPLQAMVSLVIRDKVEQPSRDEKEEKEKKDEKKSVGGSQESKRIVMRQEAPRADEKPIALEHLFTPKGGER